MEELAQEVKDKKKQILEYVVSTGKSEQQLFQRNDRWFLHLKEELKQLLKKEELLLKKEEQLREERLILLRQQQQPQQSLGVEPMDVDLMIKKPPLNRNGSDQNFIDTEKLNMSQAGDVKKYLRYLFDKKIERYQLGNCDFKDNCLEFDLSSKLTKYNFDESNHIKLLLAVSGAGKTRSLLELLYSRFGYYFVCPNTTTSFSEFGSKDLTTCVEFCENHCNENKEVERAIKLLYFVRASVCNYLIEKGFDTPAKILLAQIHPLEFFEFDMFDSLYSSLLVEYEFVDIVIENPFDFVAIDEVQIAVERHELFVVASSVNRRPFFSPLIHYSVMPMFAKFYLSGTGMNFDIFKELMESNTMKTSRITFQIETNFGPLTDEQIELYARNFLLHHKVREVDEVVSRLSAFHLCKGRPRFLTFILDRYIEINDIDVAIAAFVTQLYNIKGDMFPLKFYVRDLQNNHMRVVGNETMETIICNAVVDSFWMKKIKLFVKDDAAAKAIQYGLGFGKVSDGLLKSVEIEEPAIIECLPHLLPLSNIVQKFAEKIQTTPNPQSAGYILEYLVAFALVAKYSGLDARTHFFRVSNLSPDEYLERGESNEVCLPDAMCGPDIIYKSNKDQVIYILQVKFRNKISKQEASNASDTTDPKFFYCKRKEKKTVLTGFQQRKKDLSEAFDGLQKRGYSVKQMLFIHAPTIPRVEEGIELITKKKYPDFFNCIHKEVWDLLDAIREDFRSSANT